MITRKAQHVVVFALALGFVIVAVPRGVAASSISTIYSFGTITPDGAVPKGSLTYVNGLLFGRTTTTYKAAHDELHMVRSSTLTLTTWHQLIESITCLPVTTLMTAIIPAMTDDPV
jgi:hypothetical protein